MSSDIAIFSLTADLPAGIHFNARPKRFTESFAVVYDRNSERHPSEHPFYMKLNCNDPGGIGRM
jgi:hypothetical protein